MGRLWQTMILKEHAPIFEFLPIESLVKLKQQEYYNVLGKSDKQGSSTAFIERGLRNLPPLPLSRHCVFAFGGTLDDRIRVAECTPVGGCIEAR
mgnify:CR=1 FL=1|jgi:hypothetical protein